MLSAFVAQNYGAKKYNRAKEKRQWQKELEEER